jgi:hypothetical protein
MRALGGKWFVVGIIALLFLLSGTGPRASADIAGGFPLIGIFDLRASKGYHMEGFFFGNLVVVELSSGHVSAEYVVFGKRSGGRFRARFGQLGRLDLEFHPEGRPRSERCGPVRDGTYRGLIAFAGERDYTQVDATRARGNGIVPPAKDCASVSSAAASGTGLTTHLHAIDKRPGGGASISVLGIAARGRTLVKALLEERHGKMIVWRNAFAWVGGRNAFVSSGPGVHPAFAFLNPPKPFAGSALFEETGEAASSWTGDLSTWLPGAGREQLAGPAFSSSLCRSRPWRPGCSFEPTVQRPLLGTAQGSGSQSQAFGEARLSWSRYLRNSASSAGSTP